MDSEKINEKLLRIKISEEELYNKYNVSLRDLVNEDIREEVTKILLNIVKEAAKENDITLSNGLKLELHLSPDNTTIILDAHLIETLTKNNLIGIANFLKQKKQKSTDSDFKKFKEQLFKNMNLKNEEIELISEILKEDEIFEVGNNSNILILESNSLDKFITFSNLLKNISEGMVYKYKNHYYLIINNFENSDYYISEFLLIKKNHLFESVLKEHGNIIIKEKAVEILNSLNKKEV